MSFPAPNALKTLRGMSAAEILFGILCFSALVFTESRNYLLFHSLAEGFAIIVACGVFMLAWNSRRILDNDYLLFLGIAYLFIALLDLVHTLSYSGMGVFPGAGENIPTQMWIAARYAESLSLLAAPLFIQKIKLRPWAGIILYTLISTALIISIFTGYFPDCLNKGTGLTVFKVASEYIISAVLAAAAVLLYTQRAFFSLNVRRLLTVSIVLTIASEMSFTLYKDPYGFFNQIGHFLKIVSFYLIYKAVIVTGLTRPYDLLFRKVSESEEKYRQLFENIPVGIGYHEIVTDENGNPSDYIFREVNSSFEEQTGLRAADVLGRKVTELIPDIRESEPDLIALYGDVALNGGIKKFDIFAAPLERHYSVVAFSPAPRYFIAVFQDVTELEKHRLHLEELVEERSEELKQIFEASASGMRVVDRDFNIVKANRTLLNMLGLEWEDVKGRKCYEVLQSPQCGTDDCPLTRILNGETLVRTETEKINKDGKRMTCLVASAPYMTKGGKIIGMIEDILDITELRKLQEAVKQQDKLASLGRVAAGIAHEIRNPLSGLKMFISTLARKTENGNPLPDAEWFRDISGKMKDASSSMESIINRVMDFAKPSVLNMKPVNINSVVRDATAMVGTALRKSGITLRVDCGENLPECSADAQLISQTLLNIIGNAQEALAQTEGEKRINVRIVQEGSEIRVTVTDTGPGVPADISEQIFEPFFTTKETGTGIGLSMCRRILADHGGDVTVHNETEGGAVFTLVLPLRVKENTNS